MILEATVTHYLQNETTGCSQEVLQSSRETLEPVAEPRRWSSHCLHLQFKNRWCREEKGAINLMLLCPSSYKLHVTSYSHAHNAQHLCSIRIATRSEDVLRWLRKLRQLFHELQTNSSICAGNEKRTNSQSRHFNYNLTSEEQKFHQKIISPTLNFNDSKQTGSKAIRAY